MRITMNTDKPSALLPLPPPGIVWVRNIQSGDQDKKDQLATQGNLKTIRDLDLERRTCQKSWKSTVHAMEDEQKMR